MTFVRGCSRMLSCVCRREKMWWSTLKWRWSFMNVILTSKTIIFAKARYRNISRRCVIIFVCWDVKIINSCRGCEFWITCWCLFSLNSFFYWRLIVSRSWLSKRWKIILCWLVRLRCWWRCVLSLICGVMSIKVVTFSKSSIVLVSCTIRCVCLSMICSRLVKVSIKRRIIIGR